MKLETASGLDGEARTGPLVADAGHEPADPDGRCSGRRSDPGTDPEQVPAHSS
jgi:hypothetical protein